LSKNILRLRAAALFLTVFVAGCTTDGMPWNVDAAPAPAATAKPSLVVTDEPVPEVIYQAGSRDAVAEIAPSKMQQDIAPVPVLPAPSGNTLVARKVSSLAQDVGQENNVVGGFQDRLDGLHARSEALAGDYYGLVASINTELQSGTTAGNPVLADRWNQAQAKLDALTESGSSLNALAADVAAEASKAAYLQESIRATYGLSGAVAADHKRLQQLEDDVNKDIVGINRLLTSVNDEINRRTAQLRAERLNLQTLALSVANGELYGQNMSNSLFKKATADSQDLFKPGAAPASRRPLVIIRFDRPNVDYQQALYAAVSQALEKFPAAKFDLVAVSPSTGNPARIALASTEARKNGEGVLRALTQMGVPMERIRLSAATSRDVANSEAQLYIQ
jgi:hypothetical protein